MKKNLNLLFLLAVLAFLSCNKTADKMATAPQEGLKLTAPNGVQLARTTSELKEIIASSINRKFESVNLDYTITDIRYSSPKNGGVIADIEYKTSTGEITNVIILLDVKQKVRSSGSVRAVIEDQYILDYPSPLNVVQRVQKFSCSGPKCCQVHAIEHPNGVVDIDCTCDGCALTVE